MAATVALVASVACRAEPEPELRIVGMDYAFDAPDSVQAGPTVIRFENRGKVRHEMVVTQLSDGVLSAVFADSLVRGASTKALRATGSAILFAKPGEKNDGVALRVNFERGHRYAIICGFRDSATAPKHQTLGMFKIVAVR
jgi:hypothetical protein